MFEMIVLSMLFFLFAAAFYSPLTGIRSIFVQPESANSGLQSDYGRQAKFAAESYSFLSHLKTEIEAELFPRPTDSVLRRHYDTLVAVEVENRLALMAE